jgi:hypothetical protein
MAKMTENEPANLFTQSPLTPPVETSTDTNHSDGSSDLAAEQYGTVDSSWPVGEDTATETLSTIPESTGPMVVDVDTTSSGTTPPSSGQLPKWVIPVVPLSLFLLTRGSSAPATDEPEKPEPTRVSLVSATPAPTTKLTPSPFPTDEVTPTPATSPTPSLSPTPKATGLSNLSVEEIFAEDPQNGAKLDGQLYAGQHVNLRAKLKNTGSADARNFVSYWKLQGSLVGRNERGTVRAGAEAVYDDVNSLVYSGVLLKQEAFTYAYFADPDDILSEADTANNSKSVQVSIAATRTDLELLDIEYYKPDTGEKVATPIAGQTLLIKPVIKNLGQDKQVDYQVRWWINDNKVKEAVSKTWVLPGESKVITDGYQHTFAAGLTKIRLDVNVDNTIPETNSGNNTKTKEVPL